MRGCPNPQCSMLAIVDLEERASGDHHSVDTALADLRLHVRIGGPGLGATRAAVEDLTT